MTFKLEEAADTDRILRFLTRMDREFQPPLQTRMNLADYAEKLAGAAVNYFLVFGEDDIAHAGFYCNDARSATAFLSSIAVLPGLQGSTAAAELLQRIVETCRARQLTALQLEVDPDNQRAVHFYEKHGFRFVSAQRMEKALAVASPPSPGSTL